MQIPVGSSTRFPSASGCEIWGKTPNREITAELVAAEPWRFANDCKGFLSFGVLWHRWC